MSLQRETGEKLDSSEDASPGPAGPDVPPGSRHEADGGVGADMMPGSQEISEQILSSLRRITRAIDLQSRALMLRCGLTGPQLIVLRQLHRDGQVPIGRLAQDACVSQATVTGIVERLLARGLVEKTRDDVDRRRVLVRCSETGSRLAEEAPPVLQEKFIKELMALHDWERHLILSTLLRISSMMQADRLADSTLAVALSEGSPEEVGEPESQIHHRLV